VAVLCVLQWVLLLRAVSNKPRPVWVLNGEGAELLRGDLTFLATTQFTLWLLAQTQLMFLAASQQWAMRHVPSMP